MSFFQKVRAVTLGAAHDLLDKTIDMNSPSAVRQYARDVEAAVHQMENESAIQSGQVRTTTREKAELDNRIATDKKTIEHLLAAGTESGKNLAKVKASLVLQNQKHSDELAQTIAGQQDTADKIAASVTALQAKYQQVVAQVHELEQMDRDTKAKESANSAIQAAGSILATGNSVSVDDLKGRMQRRNDVASSRFDQSMASMPAPEEANSEDVEALLASLTPAKA